MDIEDLQKQISTLTQACIALTAHVLATQSVACNRLTANNLVPHFLLEALAETRLENYLQGRTLDEATPDDLARMVEGLRIKLAEKAEKAKKQG